MTALRPFLYPGESTHDLMVDSQIPELTPFPGAGADILVPGGDPDDVQDWIPGKYIRPKQQHEVCWWPETWWGIEQVKILLFRYLTANPHRLGEFFTLDQWLNTILSPAWGQPYDLVVGEWDMRRYLQQFFEASQRGHWTKRARSVAYRTMQRRSAISSARVGEYAVLISPPLADLEPMRRRMWQREVDEGTRLANGFNILHWVQLLEIHGGLKHPNPRMLLHEFAPDLRFQADTADERVQKLLDYCWHTAIPDISDLDPVAIREKFEVAYRADVLSIPKLGYRESVLIGLAALRDYLIGLDDRVTMRRYTIQLCKRLPPVEGAEVLEYDYSGYEPVTRTRQSTETGKRESQSCRPRKAMVCDPSLNPNSLRPTRRCHSSSYPMGNHLTARRPTR